MLHNLRTDTKLMEFANAAGVGMSSDVSLVDRSGIRATGGACTAISFRTGRGCSAQLELFLWLEVTYTT